MPLACVVGAIPTSATIKKGGCLTLLSKLVFNIVKNVKYLEDTGFNYDSFKTGEFDNDLDYSNSINNAFAPLNEALHRLSDRGKIRNQVAENLMVVGNILDLAQIEKKIKKIVSVFYINSDGTYKTFGFRELGNRRLFINSNKATAHYTMNVEFMEEIPNFERKDFCYEYTPDNLSVVSDDDIDLEDYGITESMIPYIIEYCKGVLLEQIAPEIANMHITRAEQYFADLEEQPNHYVQPEIIKVYGIEE